MTIARAVALLYWIAVGLFVVGVGLRLLGGALDVDPLSTVGEILNGIAWPIAAAGAVVDILRHRHRAHAE